MYDVMKYHVKESGPSAELFTSQSKVRTRFLNEENHDMVSQ